MNTFEYPIIECVTRQTLDNLDTIWYARVRTNTKMILQDPIDKKLKTDVCIRSLLEFGFPEQLIASDLGITIARIEEAKTLFGGKVTLPSPVTDSMEYVWRFTDFLNQPQMPIEDIHLLHSIDRSRARILATILSQWFRWSEREKKEMISRIEEVTRQARTNRNIRYCVGIVFCEIQTHYPSDPPSDNRH